MNHGLKYPRYTINSDITQKFSSYRGGLVSEHMEAYVPL